MLWFLASIFTVLGLALFIFLSWEKLPSIKAGSLALSDLVNLLAAVLTMIGLAIALGSLYVAIAAYQKSIKDSEEQEKNLDASRVQLQAVVDAATQQQEILNRNLETSKAQLALLEQQWKREQERQSRKPIVEVSLGTSKGNLSLEDLQTLTSIDFPLEANKKWGRLTFLVSNKGAIEVKRPVVKIHTFPNTVLVDEADFRIFERADHNSYQFAGDGVLDLEPIQLSGGPYTFKVDITVPDLVEAFDVIFKIHGNNLAHKQYKLHLKVKRPHA